MSFESQVEQLTSSSRSVFENCVLGNGAIIAANTDLPNYPETAVNYRYVWPRDAAFTIYAANLLGMGSEIRSGFVQWLLDRAEGFADTGTFIKRYATNGRHDTRYGHEYQPDQAGAMLWALHHTSPEADPNIDRAITLLANGLSAQWAETHFVHPTDSSLPIQDLWEDQSIASTEPSAFTYTLAAAIYGLEQAGTRLGDEVGSISDNWSFAVDSMRRVLDTTSNQSHYPWKVPSVEGERRIDASLTGLVWPFELNPSASGGLGLGTLDEIRETLYIPSVGIKRYPHDRYDGVDNANTVEDGAGTWPLLSFWHCIALIKSGQRDNADRLYRETLDRLSNDYIPEQILPVGREDRPPTPLAWSHAMFIIASQELGYS